MSRNESVRPFVKDEDRLIGVPAANHVEVKVTIGLIKKYLANETANRPFQILVQGSSVIGTRAIVEALIDDISAVCYQSQNLDHLKSALILHDVVVIDASQNNFWNGAYDDLLGLKGVVIWMCPDVDEPDEARPDVRIDLKKMTHNEKYLELSSLFVNANESFIDRLIRNSKKDIWEIDELVRLLCLDNVTNFNLAAYDTVFGIDSNPLDVDDSNDSLDDDDDLDDYLIDDDEADEDVDETEDEAESDAESTKKDDGFDL